MGVLRSPADVPRPEFEALERRLLLDGVVTSLASPPPGCSASSAAAAPASGSDHFADSAAYAEPLPDLYHWADAGWDWFSPVAVRPGDAWQCRFAVRKQGGVTGDFRVKFYASDDTSIEESDHYIGWALVSGDEANEKGYAVAVLEMSSFPDRIPGGEYYVGGIIDPDNWVAESNESNNTGRIVDNTAGDILTVSNDLPDLVGTGFRFVSEPAGWGEQFDVEYEVENQGEADADEFEIGFYLSEDSHYDEDDEPFEDGGWLPNGLGEGGAAGGTITLTMPHSSPFLRETGTFYVLMYTDDLDYVEEGKPNEDNNHGQGRSEDWDSFALDLRPDLYDDGDEWSEFDPTEMEPGEAWDCWWDIANGGDVSAGPFDVEFYASDDSEITESDHYLGTVRVADIGPGDYADADLHLDAFPSIPAGIYYVGVLIDPGDEVDESDETNNVGVDTDDQPLQVMAANPDMQVPYYNQGNTQWCWATSLSMVLRYYDFPDPSPPKPWQIAGYFGLGPDERLSLKGYDAILEYLESHYDGGAEDAWTGVTCDNIDQLVSRLQQVLPSGHPVWVDCMDEQHVIVVTGFDGVGESDHVYIHNPSTTITGKPPVRHTMTWAEFRSKVDTRPVSPKGEAVIIFGKASELQPTTTHASIEVLPSPYNGLTFNSEGHILALVWDGSASDGGYRYDVFAGGAGWYAEDDLYGYAATQADELRLRPSYGRHDLTDKVWDLHTDVEICQTAEGGQRIPVWSGTSGGHVASKPEWIPDPENCQVTYPLTNLEPGPYVLSVRLMGTEEGSSEVNELDSLEFGFAVATPEKAVDLLDAGDEHSYPDPRQVSVGESWQCQWRIRNRGGADATGFNVDFYASEDGQVDGSDHWLGRQWVQGIAAGGTEDVVVVLPEFPDLPSGSYHVGVIIDPGEAVEEWDEDNNVGVDLDGSPLRVVDPPLPDLQDAGDAWSWFAPAAIAAGEPWECHFDLYNAGAIDAGPFYVNFHASADQEIARDDPVVGIVRIAGLPAGQTAGAELHLPHFPAHIPAGDYYVGVIIDPADDVTESIESNNTGVALNNHPLTVHADANYPAEIVVRQGAGQIENGATDPVGFPTAEEGSPPPELAFTVLNTGDEGLTVGQVELLDNTGFEVSAQPDASVPGGGSTTFRLRMLTGSAGSKSADVQFANSDADEDPYGFSVSGRVVSSSPDRPTARIDSTTPAVAQPPDEQITFEGTGTPHNGTIVAYEWRSDLDGVLSGEEDFVLSAHELTVGTHVMTFCVQDSTGAWSDADTAEVTVLDAPPEASILIPHYEPPPPIPPGVALVGYDNDERGGDIVDTLLVVTNRATGERLVFHPELGGYMIPPMLGPGGYDVVFQVLDDEGTWSGGADPPTHTMVIGAAPGPEIEISDDSGDPSDLLAVLPETAVWRISASRWFAIHNTGSEALSITGLAKGGPHADDFAVSVHDPAGRDVPGDSFDVPPGQAYTIEVRFAPSAEGLREAGILFDTNDPDGGESAVRLEIRGSAHLETEPAAVVGRSIFYNNCSFDGNDPAAGASDDGAIAPDKTALLPGQTAAFANYTSYSRGINGIMIDIYGLAAPADVSRSDFAFRAGNDSSVAAWAAAPLPSSVSVREGEGAGGADRVTLIWPDHAIEKEWLQVVVLATDNTGLEGDGVFYFGNAVGECGDGGGGPDYAFVNATDKLRVRQDPRTFLNPAGLDCPHDFDRDKKVNATDELLVRDNGTTFLTALKLITAPGGQPPAPGGLFASAANAPREPLEASAAAVDETPRISVGTHQLMPNTPNQTIELRVTGGQLVRGLNLNAQIGDGGPELGGTPGPAITGVDLENGTIFDGNNDGQNNLGLPGTPTPQLAMYSIIAHSADVAADGLLARLTIDTSGFHVGDGPWPLCLDDTLNGSTDFAGSPALIADGSIVVREPAGLAGRHVFYNGSARDGGDPGANAADDAAVAADKHPLLPDETASPANHTCYSRGINGIMVDIDGLWNPAGLSAADFVFKAGNSDEPGTWTDAPAPVNDIAADVRLGAGTGGADRVTMIWADGAICGGWLQVTVLPAGNVGLPEGDEFYLGNLPGDTNCDGRTNHLDYLALKQSFGDGAALPEDPADFDCSGAVDYSDYVTLRDTFGQSIATISPPPLVPPGMGARDGPAPDGREMAAAAPAAESAPQVSASTGTGDAPTASASSATAAAGADVLRASRHDAAWSIGISRRQGPLLVIPVSGQAHAHHGRSPGRSDQVDLPADGMVGSVGRGVLSEPSPADLDELTLTVLESTDLRAITLQLLDR